MHQVFGTRHSDTDPSASTRDEIRPLSGFGFRIFSPRPPLPCRRALRLVGRQTRSCLSAPFPRSESPTAGASKTPAGGGSVLCRYRVARSPWRAATVDGAQFRPNPNARPERDETLTFRSSAQAKDSRRLTRLVLRVTELESGLRVVTGETRDSTRLDRCARTRPPAPTTSPSLVPGRHIRQLRAVPRPRRRRSSARRATLAILVRRGAPLLPAPRCGWAWKRRGKTTTDASALSFASFFLIARAKLERSPGPDADRRPRCSPVSLPLRVDQVAMTTTLEAVCE